MARPTAARLGEVERRLAAARPALCPECGWPPGDAPVPKGFPVVLAPMSFEEREESCGPERCPACGRKLVLRMSFDER